MSLVVTKENFQEIREKGIGNGFSVIDPKDGYRKDNRLWFGTCSVCNEMVTNSAIDGRGWLHKLVLVDEVLPGGGRHQSSRSVTYCLVIGE
jgi:hypothetical protein